MVKITFVSLNKEFIDLMAKIGFESHKMLIQDYRPTSKNVYYVSPANSLGFMNGGIDKALSRIVLPGIESIVKNSIRINGKTTKLGRKYLPIGSSIIVEPIKEDIYLMYLQNKNLHLIVAPTMLLPQDVSKTNNAYYATISSLYNVIKNAKDINDTEIIFTSMCCGYGAMTSKQSTMQIIKAIQDYRKYDPVCINNKIVLKEPNLDEQPKYYQNTEWIDIPANEIIKVD